MSDVPEEAPVVKGFDGVESAFLRLVGAVAA
jgi:hypothetical protein